MSEPCHRHGHNLVIDNSEHNVECVVKHMGQGVPDYPMSDRQMAQDSLLCHLPV